MFRRNNKKERLEFRKQTELFSLTIGVSGDWKKLPAKTLALNYKEQQGDRLVKLSKLLSFHLHQRNHTVLNTSNFQSQLANLDPMVTY